jgi:diaminopimelate epimerase
VEFVKAHGTGNDFVVVEDLNDHYQLTPELVRAVCDRHFGVGADGLIRIAPGTEAPFFMDYRNADGSLAEMCGNGVRVVGKYLGDRGLVAGAFDLETRAGVKHLELHADDGGCIDRVTVDMGAPTLGDERTLEVDGEPVIASTLSMGNPHAVVFVDDAASARRLAETLGPALDTHAWFPRKANAEWCHVAGPDTLDLVVWERGCGITLACGTGACATAVAACVTGRAEVGRELTVRLPGGALAITVAPDYSTVFMRGPARFVFETAVDLDVIAAAARPA